MLFKGVRDEQMNTTEILLEFGILYEQLEVARFNSP